MNKHRYVNASCIFIFTHQHVLKLLFLFFVYDWNHYWFNKLRFYYLSGKGSEYLIIKLLFLFLFMIETITGSINWDFTILEVKDQSNWACELHLITYGFTLLLRAAFEFGLAITSMLVIWVPNMLVLWWSLSLDKLLVWESEEAGAVLVMGVQIG